METITIQRFARGFLCRKEKDLFSFDILKKALKNYTQTLIIEQQLNDCLNNKKIRMSNFPSHISENIVKICIRNKYKIWPSWDSKVGDLTIAGLKLEVKGFISNGPMSFGPTEKWDILYIIDGTKILENYFTVYEIKLKNIDSIFKKIMVNKNETFEIQCLQKRRPRISFKELHKQIPDNIKVIFKGTLDF